MKKVIPIFYACDDAFVKYTIVSLSSMIKNASRDYEYKIHVLYTDISEEMKRRTMELENENFKISFVSVSKYLESISDKLPLRHYYSKTTYYRLFISEMFKDIDKALYIDSDTIIKGDISALYNTDVSSHYLAACREQAMEQVDVYGTYAERVVGVSRHEFFNAGVILINCERFRREKILGKFIHYLGIYDFIVTQDEDYLNLVCKGGVLWLDQKWNTELTEGLEYEYDIDEANILHFIMVNKPWHYELCRGADVYWSYAKNTSVYEDLTKELSAYSDEARRRDRDSAIQLLQMAIEETERKDNFLNVWGDKLPLV